MNVTPEKPTDEITDSQCLICKKPAPLSGTSARQQGKYITIHSRRVWLCADDLAAFERGRRIGQIELNAKVVQCLSTLDNNQTGWKLKEKILGLVPATKRSAIIRSQLADITIPSPRDIYATLSETVIGQERAKKIVSLAVHEHYANMQKVEKVVVPSPQHVLFIGPSGSGKTLIASTVAMHLDVPYVAADATVFSPTGFQGADVDSMIAEMAQKARGATALAERGVIFLDELDKLAAFHHEGKPEAMNKSTQSALLRMVEGKQVRVVQSPGEIATVSTEKMLFMFGGAFNGLSDIVARRMGFKGRGIGIRDHKEDAAMEKAVRCHEVLSQASYDVLVESLEEYGVITELLGRIPSIVPLAPLTEEELRRVALETAHSPLFLQQQLFLNSGYFLEFTEAFVDEMVRRAHKMATGVRALRALTRLAVSDAAFDLLGGPTAEAGEEAEIAIKGTVVLDVDSLSNASQYTIKPGYAEICEREMTITA